MILFIFTLSTATALFAVQWHLSVLALLASCGCLYAGVQQGISYERERQISERMALRIELPEYNDLLKEREEWHGY